MMVEIDADHPVAALSNLIRKEGKVYLPGQSNDWDDPKCLEFNEETGKFEGVIEGKNPWDESREAECKFSIYCKGSLEVASLDIEEAVSSDSIKKKIMIVELESRKK